MIKMTATSAKGESKWSQVTPAESMVQYSKLDADSGWHNSTQLELPGCD
jgi:hypothetical protein